MANSNIPSSYGEARRWIADGRSGTERKVANNTWLHLHFDGSVDAHGHPTPAVAVQYHSTIIALFEHNGRVTLRTGGWTTSTTKERLNIIAGKHARISQRDFRWYVTTFEHGEAQPEEPWFEGFSFIDHDQATSHYYATRIETGD